MAIHEPPRVPVPETADPLAVLRELLTAQAAVTEKEAHQLEHESSTRSGPGRFAARFGRYPQDGDGVSLEAIKSIRHEAQALLEAKWRKLGML